MTHLVSFVKKKAAFVFLPFYLWELRKLKKQSLESCILTVVEGQSRFARCIRSNQKITEITAFLNRAMKEKPTRVVEIGTARGGTLFLLARLIADSAGIIISMDIAHPWKPGRGGYPFWKIPLYKNFGGRRQTIRLIRANTHSPRTLQRLGAVIKRETVDVLFIDGDHSYEGVKNDFEWYAPFVRRGGIIAFHDIVPGPPENVGGVPEFWNEIKGKYPHAEFVDDWNQGGYGIGIIVYDSDKTAA
ncbi:MAG: class I SAM-dependent methyltransferase [Candidatus Paceibacterota bacterium]